jgi:RHS repeat-associated protein
MGRRARKQVYVYASGIWTLNTEKLFVYDGWNLIKEVTKVGGVPSDKFYVWGLDLSQSLQGAGGIGGLVRAVQAGEMRHFFYDANGNVGQVVNETGSIVARYEYDPFGNALVADGAYAQENPFRFSTKHYDEETGLYYYGFRDYSAELGRWWSRDLIGEKGGINLYGFIGNDGIGNHDMFGLFPRKDQYGYLAATLDCGYYENHMKEVQEEINLKMEVQSIRWHHIVSIMPEDPRFVSPEQIPVGGIVRVLNTPEEQRTLDGMIERFQSTSEELIDLKRKADHLLRRYQQCRLRCYCPGGKWTVEYRGGGSFVAGYIWGASIGGVSWQATCDDKKNLTMEGWAVNLLGPFAMGGGVKVALKSPAFSGGGGKTWGLKNAAEGPGLYIGVGGSYAEGTIIGAGGEGSLAINVYGSEHDVSLLGDGTGGSAGKAVAGPVAVSYSYTTTVRIRRD